MTLSKSDSNNCLPGNFRKFLKTPFLTEHLRWLLLKRINEGNSLVKIFHPVILTHFESITDGSEKCPLKKIMNNCDC